MDTNRGDATDLGDGRVPAQLRSEPFDSPLARDLIAAVQQEYVRLYGGPDATPVDPADFAPPLGDFLMVFVAGVPVACGGWRSHGLDAELKRMYVVPQMRGRGLARKLLAALEASAAAAGRRRVILETGDRQPEAIGLYTSSGYAPIAGYGIYRCEPGSRYFAKVLAGGEGAGDPAEDIDVTRPQKD